MKKVNVSISKSYRLINYGPVVLITSAYGKRQNVATIAWAVPLSSDPVLVGVAIYEEHFTRKLIAKSKEFVVNVPSAEILRKVKECGKTHGNKVDKFRVFGLTPLSAAKVRTPLLSECFAHLECRVAKMVKIGDHTLFVGKVVSACANRGLAGPDGIVKIKKVKTLHHLGGDEFGTLKGIR